MLGSVGMWWGDAIAWTCGGVTPLHGPGVGYQSWFTLDRL